MGLRRQAFWLYGVLVGLSIKQALLAVLPDIIRAVPELLAVLAGTSEGPANTPFFLETARLVVYLVLIVRFFLGSAYYFRAVYQDDDFNPLAFGLDFLSGFFHFILFFGTTLTIDTDSAEEWLFPTMVGVLLAYDFIWLIVCRRFDHHGWIKRWTVVNGLTLILATLVYLIVKLRWDPQTCELWAYAVIVVASAIDIAGLVQGRFLIADWFGQLRTGRGEDGAE